MALILFRKDPTPMKKKYLEKDVQSKTVREARSLGFLCYKLNGGSFNGLPDYLLLKGGMALFIEFKATGKTPTKLQQKLHDDFFGHGVPVHVVDHPDEGIKLIREIDAQLAEDRINAR